VVYGCGVVDRGWSMVRGRGMMRNRCWMMYGSMMRSRGMIRSRVVVWVHCCAFICYLSNITTMVVSMVVDSLGTAIG